MRDVIRAGLVATLNPQLVDELLEAHAEAKRNYFLGGLRLAEVEGGRFCEAAFRLIYRLDDRFACNRKIHRIGDETFFVRVMVQALSSFEIRLGCDR